MTEEQTAVCEDRQAVGVYQLAAEEDRQENVQLLSLVQKMNTRISSINMY